LDCYRRALLFLSQTDAAVQSEGESTDLAERQLVHQTRLPAFNTGYKGKEWLTMRWDLRL
jgi:hypothetical protein